MQHVLNTNLLNRGTFAQPAFIYSVQLPCEPPPPPPPPRPPNPRIAGCPPEPEELLAEPPPEGAELSP